MLIKAIGESTGRSLAVIKSDLKKEGDLGLVAMVSLAWVPVFQGGLIRDRAIQELEEQPKDYFQAQTTHSPFCLHASEGNCFKYRSLSESKRPYNIADG